jgi:hypothetical protein
LEEPSGSAGRMSNARETLDKARFFLTEAENAGLDDRKRLERMIEAAIVFGRSVTFHLQKEFAHVDGFSNWYVEQQRKMREDPLCVFFLEKRNFILKEGPVPIGKTITVTMTEAIAVSSSFSARVLRGKPWYRRHPRILVQDLLRPMREAWSDLKVRQTRRRRRQAFVDAAQSQAQEYLHFDDPDWKARPALDVLDEYLEKLKPVVDEAEEKFG